MLAPFFRASIDGFRRVWNAQTVADCLASFSLPFPCHFPSRTFSGLCSDRAWCDASFVGCDALAAGLAGPWFLGSVARRLTFAPSARPALGSDISPSLPLNSLTRPHYTQSRLLSNELTHSFDPSLIDCDCLPGRSLCDLCPADLRVRSLVPINTPLPPSHTASLSPAPTMDPYNPFGYTLPPTMPVYINAAMAAPAPYGFDLHSAPRQPLAPLPNNLPLMTLPLPPSNQQYAKPLLNPNSNPMKRAASTSILPDASDSAGGGSAAKRPTKARASSAKPSLTAANNKRLEPLLPSYTANIAGPASDENTPFECPRCDKVYKGKHARSIWRRHMQDKHGVALKDQPRRTRWDNGKSPACLKIALICCVFRVSAASKVASARGGWSGGSVGLAPPGGGRVQRRGMTAERSERGNWAGPCLLRPRAPSRAPARDTRHIRISPETTENAAYGVLTAVGPSRRAQTRLAGCQLRLALAQPPPLPKPRITTPRSSEAPG